EASVDHRSRFDGLVHALERHPGAAIARHCPAVEPIIEKFLHPGGIEDRNHYVDEMIFGLVRGGGRFGRMVVAHEREHAAGPRGPGKIGVPEDVAAAIDPRALAVPEAEHAVVPAFAAQLGLLAAPERSGGEILVEAGLEHDIVAVEPALGAHELLIEPAER